MSPVSCSASRTSWPCLRASGVRGWEERLLPVSEYMREQLATGDYPHVAEFIGDDDLATVVRRLVSSSAPEERFNRGLERLLDGVQLEIERSGAA